jgi:uncharacterized protein
LSSWSRLLEVDRLVETEADIEFAGALTELAALRSLPAEVTGNVRGRARFSREQGFAVVELSIDGSAVLECQRCLQPMELPLAETARIALVDSESESARVPGQLEPVLAAAGRISIGELVAQELLLALPIVALHSGDESCVRAPRPAPTASSGETHRPFGGLAELLKR